jgi:hypothetical protein
MRLIAKILTALLQPFALGQMHPAISALHHILGQRMIARIGIFRPKYTKNQVNYENYRQKKDKSRHFISPLN